MPRDVTDMDAPELLTFVMRRRGWNPARLAELTQGQISISSVRAYAKGTARPRQRAALALAEAIGPERGPDLLIAWGYPEMAEGFLDRWRVSTFGTDERLHNQVSHTFRVNRIEYSGQPLSEEMISNVVRIITWFQALEERAQDGR